MQRGRFRLGNGHRAGPVLKLVWSYPISAGSDGDSGVEEDQAGVVVDESAGEVEEGGGVVTALLAALIGDAHVDLLEPFDGKAESAYVRSRSGGFLTKTKGHPVHGKCVGHCR